LSSQGIRGKRDKTHEQNMCETECFHVLR
jgi:hypothetical protein